MSDTDHVDDVDRIDRTRMWRVVPGAVTWRTMDAETIVLDMVASSYQSMNGPATLMWDELSTHGASLATLTDRLLAEFDVEPDTAAHDAAAFLADCVERRWID